MKPQVSFAGPAFIKVLDSWTILQGARIFMSEETPNHRQRETWFHTTFKYFEELGPVECLIVEVLAILQLSPELGILRNTKKYLDRAEAQGVEVFLVDENTQA